MVEILLIIAAVYLLMGVLFVIPFLMKGLKKVDEGAHGSTVGFKIIIIPGVIVLWPMLLSKWMTNLNHEDTKAPSNTKKT
jgi:Na+-driven multidrug efflux pump